VGQRECGLSLKGNDCYNRGLTMTENQIGKRILDLAFEIHTELGPGLLETVYEVVLAHELRGIGTEVERQKASPHLSGNTLRRRISRRSDSRK
jgi:hypothetical protein